MAEAMKLRELVGDEDAQLLADTIEGETDVFSLIDRLAERALADKLLVERGKERLKRIEAREDRARAIVQKMMEALGVAKLDRSLATLSVSAGPTSAHVTDSGKPFRTATGDARLIRPSSLHAAEGRNAVSRCGTEQRSPGAHPEEQVAMNALTETAPVSAQALEHILGTGDLSKLSTQQRVEFYAKTCQSLGLNPLTRPFRFMSFQGNTVMYATRDCTDQLRKVNGITLHVVDKQLDGELFIVTVRARDRHGREDEDMGAVTLGKLTGESRANALMKALTKAKRRVTLSICGLGLTDEAELDTMPGSTTFDADDEPPVAPIRAAAAGMQRAPKVTEREPDETPRPRTRRGLPGRAGHRHTRRQERPRGRQAHLLRRGDAGQGGLCWRPQGSAG